MSLNRVDLKTSLALLLLGCVLVVLYRAGVASSGVSGIRFFMKVAFVQSAIYLVAAWIVTRARSSNSTLLIAIAFAVLFRASILLRRHISRMTSIDTFGMGASRLRASILTGTFPQPPNWPNYATTRFIRK